MNVLDELLKEACRNGNLKEVSSLLRVGANINCENGLPLMLAVYNNHTELVEYLLQADADGSVAYIAAILQQNGGHARILTEYKQNPCKDPYLRQLAFQLSQIATESTGYDWNELFKKLQENLETKFENTDRRNWIPPMPIHIKQNNEEKIEEVKKKRNFFWFFSSFPFPLKRLKNSEEKVLTIESKEKPQCEENQKADKKAHIPLPEEILQKSSPDYENVRNSDLKPSQVQESVVQSQKVLKTVPVRQGKPITPVGGSLGSVDLLKREDSIENKVTQTKNQGLKEENKGSVSSIKAQKRTQKKTSRSLLLEAAERGDVESIKILLQLVEDDIAIYQAFKISIENNFFSSATILLDENPRLLHFNDDEVYKNMMQLGNEKVMKYLRKKDPNYEWLELAQAQHSKQQKSKEERKVVKEIVKEDDSFEKTYEIETIEGDIYADINYDELVEKDPAHTQDKMLRMLIDSVSTSDMKRLSLLAQRVPSQSQDWNNLALWAVENCEEKEILDFLWQYVDVHDGDEALLAAAVSYRNCTAAKTLLEAGANANARAGMIMVLAARNRDAEMVRILANDGFPALESTLIFAINNNNQAIVETIKKAQVDVSFYIQELEKLAKEKGCPMILRKLREE